MGYEITNNLNHVKMKSPNGDIRLYEKGAWNIKVKGNVIEFREIDGGGIMRIPAAGSVYTIIDNVAGYNPATPTDVEELFDIIAPFFLAL